MPAARSTDWAHIRINGDKQRGAAYLSYGRKVLGFVIQEAERTGQSTYSHSVRLNDGAVISAEIHGLQRIVTIDVPTVVSGSLEPKLPEDFVVWARDADLPDGIDVDHPQQIIRTQDWRTFFYDTSSTTYADFEGPKGTYRFNAGVDVFPDGIKRAGNLDWVDKEGVRISWYGPSSRYCFDPFVYSRTQYGTWVFMLGQTLLDMDAYLADIVDDPGFTETYVMGAAVQGDWLYVVHAELPVEPTRTANVPANTFYSDYMYTATSVPTRFSRFRLIAHDTLPAPHRMVAPDSREELWADTLPQGANPWFFSPDISVGHSIGLPSTFSAFAPQTGGLTPPPASSPVYRLARLAEDSFEFTTSSLQTVPNGSSTIAADYAQDGSVRELTVRRRIVTPTAGPGQSTLREQVFFELAGASVRMVDCWVAANSDRYCTQRFLAYADCRTGVMVLFRDEYRIPASTITIKGSRYLEIWKGGVLTREILVTTADADLGSGLLRDLENNFDWRSYWREYTVAPQYFLYNFTVIQTTLSSFVSSYACYLAGYVFLPRQVPCYFGSRRNTGGSAQPPLPISNWVSVQPAHEKLDFNGKDITIGCASNEQTTVYSSHSGVVNGTGSLYFMTERELPAMTGVEGDDSRYHPVWILGTSPQPL